MTNYLEPPLCIHSFPVGTTRAGTPRCPICRRVTPPPAPKPRRTYTQPALDVAMLAAGDDTHQDDAQVLDLRAARARRRTR